MKYEVQFYSFFANKYVTISKHRKLDKAIEKARQSWCEDGYNQVSILVDSKIRLDRYGKEYFIQD